MGKELSEKWELKVFDDVLTIKNGKNQKKVENIKGMYPIYGSGGIMSYADEYLCPEFTTIIGRKGSINNPIYVEEKFWNVDTAFGLIPNQMVLNPKYLFYFCVQYNFEKHNKAVTIPSLTKGDLLQIKIPLPPLEVQKEIARNLDLASELVKLHKRKLEELDKLIQSVFYDMFGDPVRNEMGWEVKKASESLNVIGGYAFKSSGFRERGIPVLKIANINSGILKMTNLVFWEEENELERYAIYPGDLVISLTGTVGKDDYGNACIVNNMYSKYYLNQRNAKLQIYANLEKEYLTYLLKDKKIKLLLTGVSRGVRQANISNTDILNLCIPIPTLSLQKKFAEIVIKIENEKIQEQEALADSEMLYNSLMQTYFN